MSFKKFIRKDPIVKGLAINNLRNKMCIKLEKVANQKLDIKLLEVIEETVKEGYKLGRKLY